MSSIKSTIKALVSPSLRFRVKENLARAERFLRGLRFWKWQRVEFALHQAGTIKVDYLGNPAHVPLLKSLLQAPKDTGQDSNGQAPTLVLKIRPYPMWDQIVLPAYLTTIVTLNRSLEEIMGTYSRSLRRSINQDAPQYRHESVTNPDRITELDNKMLRPYATARHDSSAAQLDAATVMGLARSGTGRLDVLYQGDQEVGCHLGNAYEVNGKKYWQVNRLGYPEAIFSDYKRWGEVNSINLHLALGSAIHNGYDYCDYGMSLAKPGSGLIEWKRRRKGFLSTNECYQFFFMKFPNIGASQFFWESPVFGVEKPGITLHLGLPAGKTDDEIAERYHEMGYDGLYKVYLHGIQAPSAALMEKIKSLYADLQVQPQIITYIVK
jgi:hypothetical protein